ncbi:TfdA family taurine dioxygenase [Lindgomyces ingoldianus]|uniref:TfdA family taurine dioxygenase n=1 Tax=Lindgomyces ingoldianus TaxID=673940 RepID=A0ACB6QBH9_9PLEO|nr:TfdA family taurine dioxygenase [Lindgomyces ingoldianus]KAF2464220.1 TfdA family taurine dioxygenase [Lindgomyces ingoldianus]
MPSATENGTNGATNGTSNYGIPASCPSCPEPLKYSGTLDQYPYFEVTPIIGREYPTLKVTDILRAPNAKEQIRDLAIIISERGVVFFRDQGDLNVPDQKKFCDLLGKLSGRPEENGLHVHPIYRDPGNLKLPDGTTDENIASYVINSDAQKKIYKTMAKRQTDEPRDLSREWHSDSTFENVPSDFSFLKMEETPPHGGDTLWCSGYEIYDRISPPFRSFLEGLTATCAQPVFRSAAAAGNYEVMSPRGSPLNTGDEFAPSHPVVRTNRITGWKAIFAGVGLHVTKINGVYAHEDQMIRDYIMRLITRNHDCIARMKWTKNAAAIWNNTCVWHAATPDTHLVEGNRVGVRASSIGEIPYLDPNSKSRREALGIPIV